MRTKTSRHRPDPRNLQLRNPEEEQEGLTHPQRRTSDPTTWNESDRSSGQPRSPGPVNSPTSTSTSRNTSREVSTWLIRPGNSNSKKDDPQETTQRDFGCSPRNPNPKSKLAGSKLPYLQLLLISITMILNLPESITASVTIHPELLGPVMGYMDAMNDRARKYAMDQALQRKFPVNKQIELYNQTTSQLDSLTSKIQTLFQTPFLRQHQGELLEAYLFYLEELQGQKQNIFVYLTNIPDQFSPVKPPLTPARSKLLHTVLTHYQESIANVTSEIRDLFREFPNHKNSTNKALSLDQLPLSNFQFMQDTLDKFKSDTIPSTWTDLNISQLNPSHQQYLFETVDAFAHQFSLNSNLSLYTNHSSLSVGYLTRDNLVTQVFIYQTSPLFFYSTNCSSIMAFHFCSFIQILPKPNFSLLPIPQHRPRVTCLYSIFQYLSQVECSPMQLRIIIISLIILILLFLVILCLFFISHFRNNRTFTFQ